MTFSASYPPDKTLFREESFVVFIHVAFQVKQVRRPGCRTCLAGTTFLASNNYVIHNSACKDCASILTVLPGSFSDQTRWLPTSSTCPLPLDKTSQSSPLKGICWPLKVTTPSHP